MITSATCILLKSHYTKFGVSNLFFSKVNRRKTFAASARAPLVQEGLRQIDLAHGPCPKPGPVCYATANKLLLTKIDMLLEYLNTRTVLKLVLDLYLQSFRSFQVNIITLATSGKSVVVKNLSRNVIVYFSAFYGS